MPLMNNKSLKTKKEKEEEKKETKNMNLKSSYPKSLQKKISIIEANLEREYEEGKIDAAYKFDQVGIEIFDLPFSNEFNRFYCFNKKVENLGATDETIGVVLGCYKRNEKANFKPSFTVFKEIIRKQSIWDVDSCTVVDDNIEEESNHHEIPRDKSTIEDSMKEILDSVNSNPKIVIDSIAIPETNQLELFKVGVYIDAENEEKALKIIESSLVNVPNILKIKFLEKL
jgi:hypothetical protein